jgi:CrcB protein
MSRFFFDAILVASGSACGGIARWLVGLGCAALLGTTFPWGTLLVNLSGSFILGWIGTLVANDFLPGKEEVRLLLMVGFCGGFTTFSTFKWEADKLFKADSSWLAILYITMSVFLGLVALRLGVSLAHVTQDLLSNKEL